MKRCLILAALLAAGCASQRHGYPSLAHRPVEDGGFDEPSRAAPVLTPDPDLDRQIATLSSSVDVAAADYAKALPDARKRTATASGKPAGSEAWVDAQQALAALDDARARVATLATTADDLAGARAAKLLPAYPALDALSQRIDAELANERGTIDQLQSGLAPA